MTDQGPPCALCGARRWRHLRALPRVVLAHGQAMEGRLCAPCAVAAEARGAFVMTIVEG